MTDPVTNVEIEDVLSSIRRLVSENARSESRTAPAPRREAPLVMRPAEKTGDGNGEKPAAAAPEAKSKPNDGMLVLTPAHRIETDEELAEAVADEVAETAPLPPEETHHWADDGAESALEATADLAGLEALIADAVEEAVDEAIDEVETAAAAKAPAAAEGEEIAESDWEDFDIEAGEDSEEEGDVAALFASLRFTHTEPAPDDGELSSLASRIAGLEAAVAARDDQWEPDGEGEGDNAGAPLEGLSWEDEGDAEGPAHAWEADPLDPLDAAEEAEDELQTRAQPAPEADVIDAPEVFAADPQLAQNLDPEPGTFSELDSVMDEDTLRELVAEIVRRELQGSLGERITRNVRKLVRREIHRALAARELD